MRQKQGTQIAESHITSREVGIGGDGKELKDLFFVCLLACLFVFVRSKQTIHCMRVSYSSDFALCQNYSALPSLLVSS